MCSIKNVVRVEVLKIYLKGLIQSRAVAKGREAWTPRLFPSQLSQNVVVLVPPTQSSFHFSS